MDWSSRRIHQRRQGSNLPYSHLDESTPPSGSIFPETADRIERGFFADHPHHHAHRLPHRFNLQQPSHFSPHHYYPRYHPPRDTCTTILREMMVREKIREEILMSEVARRRALEAEVRYELMLEQQSNRSPLPLHSSPRHSFLSPSRLPLTGSCSWGSRRPLEEKTVTSSDALKSHCEPKPAEENLSGSKRKALEAETSGSSSKIRAKEAWSCAFCLFNGTSKQGLEEHLNGEKHRANEGALRSESAHKKNHGAAELLTKKETTEPIRTVPAKASPLKNEVKEALESESSQVEKPEEEDGDVVANDKGYRFWCGICGVGTFSRKVMNSHEAGRKHKRRRRVHNRDRTLCTKNDVLLPPVNQQESVSAEDGSKGIGVSKPEAGGIREEGEEVRTTMGSEVVDVIKEEDWWAFMDVAS